MGSGFCGFFALFPVDASVFADMIDDSHYYGNKSRQENDEDQNNFDYLAANQKLNGFRIKLYSFFIEIVQAEGFLQSSNNLNSKTSLENLKD